MEAPIRKPYQGVFNILRFNWHFYLIASAIVIVTVTASFFLDSFSFWCCVLVIVGTVASVLISLAVSYYVYDHSSLYKFTWLKEVNHQPSAIANLHAGFDETSWILKKKFPSAQLCVCDFYDGGRHKEVSIVRARKAYPPFPETVKVTTDNLPFEPNSFDVIFNIFALHEVRDRAERIDFLKRQASALEVNGTCIVVEHLRDLPNFLAYNIGFFHFHSENEWKSNFFSAGLTIEKKFNITAFVSVFVLKKS